MEEKPWLSHYDPPVPHSLAPYPNDPLFTFLEQSARQFPARACAVFQGRSVSYHEIEESSNRLAAALVSLGVRRGDRVALCMPNIPQFIPAFFGILKAGGVVVNLNPLYTAPELERQLQDAGPEIVLTMSAFYRRIKEVQPRTRLRTLIVTNVKEALPPLKSVLFGLLLEQKGGHRVRLAPGDVWLKDLVSRPAPRPNLPLGGDDMALIQYTGGTTGLAKGAIITHRNLVANTLQMRAWLHCARQGREITLMAIPLFHVYGLVAGLSLSIQAAATMVMIPDPRQLADLLGSAHKHRATALPGVPTLFESINQHPGVRTGKVRLDSLRICVSGSASLPPGTKQEFERLTGGMVIEGYGLSEAPTVTHGNPFDGQNKAGSIGLPLPDVECRIVSLEDGRTILPPGETGEMILRSPQVFQGYWNAPSATAEALRQGPEGGQPWLYTGDVALMDEDGYFYIIDRKKEMIKAGGIQVLPREVEDVLLSHPKIKDASVAGVPDPYRGETPKAWIVLEKDQALSEAEIKAYCAASLAPYKIPTRFEFRPELPKSLIGKTLRRDLVAQHKATTPET